MFPAAAAVHNEATAAGAAAGQQTDFQFQRESSDVLGREALLFWTEQRSKLRVGIQGVLSAPPRSRIFVFVLLEMLGHRSRTIVMPND
jgi:hypothetical protein